MNNNVTDTTGPGKKIAILTCFRAINYGAALQATALQESVKRENCHVEFLDYRRDINPPVLGKGGGIFGKLKFLATSAWPYFKTANARKESMAKFADYLYQYQSVSPKPLYDKEDLANIANDYSGFIAGSDMIWSLAINPDLDYYFMTFAPESKRLSYAASMTGTREFTEEQKQRYKEYLTGVKHISCREEDAISFVKEQTGRDATLAADPTLLLSKADWSKLFSIKQQRSKPYILCYMFNATPAKQLKEIYALAKAYDMDVRFIPMSISEMYSEVKHGYLGGYGPREFVEIIFNASFVVTNSYHGLLFSIIGEKPFALYHRESDNHWKSSESRMNQILKLVDKEDCYLSLNEPLTKAYFERQLASSINKEKLNRHIETSRHYLQTILAELPAVSDATKSTISRRNIESLSAKECCGCELCVTVCPKNCISLQADNEGFNYPKIEADKCIDCGLCAKQCPQINDTVERYRPQECRAAFSTDSLVENSASGGAFITAAKYVVERQGGVAFGVRLNADSLECEFAESETVDGLRQFQDSKYIQANVNRIYERVKQYLDDGRKVLFSGLPCHIAALRTYLAKGYDNLVCIDLICHGVPSPEYWHRYLQSYRAKVRDVRFRCRDNRRKGTHTLSLSLSTVRRKLRPGFNDIYLRTYIDVENLRRSCYYCKYASPQRCGDITIGDFDSVDQLRGFYDYEQKNVICLNTDKGRQLWADISNRFESKPIDFETEARVNCSLSTPSNMPRSRTDFYIDLMALPWPEFVRKYSKVPSLAKRILITIIRTVKR